VPAKLGDQGVEGILELKLSPEEEVQFRRSAESVRELVEKMHARSARG
jgi:malate/lactate dehydrogenase